MQILIIVSSVVIMLTIAFYNAFVFKLYFTRSKSDNKIVHRLGGLLRLFWMVAIAATCWLSEMHWGKAAFFILLNINLAWTIFDLIYNWKHNHPWYYSGSLKSGTSSVIDKFFNKFDEWIKGGLVVLTILWLPFNIPFMIEDMILNRWLDLIIAIVLIIGFGYLSNRILNKKGIF